MAFTIASFVADPTLATGNLRLPAYAADPTLLLTYTRLPAYVLDPTAVVQAKLPNFIVPGAQAWRFPTATGTATQSTYSSATLQAITASGTATQSPAGSSLNGALPLIQATGTANSDSIPTLQLITGAGTAVTGSLGVSSLLPLPLPYPVANGQVNPLSVSQGQLLPLVGASGTADPGSLGSSSATLELLRATGLAGINAVGTSQLVLPRPVAAGTAYLGTGATFSAVVLQTQMQGVSTYTNFLFNSFARFNGATLAAGDAGLFSLAGDKDDGVNIDAAAATGITDFSTSFRKRIERVYVGYRTAGNLILRVRTDEVRVRDYLVPRNSETGLHGAHVKLGRGLEAQYWQFELRNQDGASFTLDRFEAKPIKLARRVGGADA